MLCFLTDKELAAPDCIDQPFLVGTALDIWAYKCFSFGTGKCSTLRQVGINSPTYLAKAFCISNGVSDTEEMTAEREQRQKSAQKGWTLE